MKRTALLALLAGACTTSAPVLNGAGKSQPLPPAAKISISSPGSTIRDLVVLGDIDGDGIDDLAVLDDGFEIYGGAPSNGAIAIIYGGRGLPASVDLAQLPHLTSDIIAGELGVAAVGDLDGDGLADFVITSDCPTFEASQATETYVVYGSRTRLSGRQEVTQLGAARLTLAGNCNPAASGVDLDGDGKSDLVLSASVPVPGFPTPGNGRVYVFYGGARLPKETTLAQADAVLTSADDWYLGQQSLSPVGDVNGDGLPDLFVGSAAIIAYAGPPIERLRAHLVYGSATRLRGEVTIGDIGTEIVGDLVEARVQQGTRVGDLDGDGIDDFAVASSGSGTLAYVFYGRLGGFGAQLDTANAGAHFISAAGGDMHIVGGIADVDSSGRPGIVIGDPDRAYSRGAVYLLGGGTPYRGEVDVDRTAEILYGDVVEYLVPPFLGTSYENVEQAGLLVTSGDLDGDGRADLITADGTGTIYVVGTGN